MKVSTRVEKPPLVKVTWWDARTFDNKEWEAIKKEVLHPVESIGYLYSKDKDLVRLVYFFDPWDLVTNDGILIPTGWIKRIVYLEEKKKK